MEEGIIVFDNAEDFLQVIEELQEAYINGSVNNGRLN